MYLVLKVLNNVLSYWTSDFSRYCKIKNNFLFVCVCVCVCVLCTICVKNIINQKTKL